MSPKDQVRQALLDIDNSGIWAVVSGLLAFTTFLLETVNDARFGGWDVLYRDDVNLFYYGLSQTTISYLEGVTTTLFSLEFAARLWTTDDQRRFWTSPFTWVDGLSALPSLLAAVGVDR